MIINRGTGNKRNKQTIQSITKVVLNTLHSIVILGTRYLHSKANLQCLAWKGFVQSSLIRLSYPPNKTPTWFSPTIDNSPSTKLLSVELIYKKNRKIHVSSCTRIRKDVYRMLPLLVPICILLLTLDAKAIKHERHGKKKAHVFKHKIPKLTHSKSVWDSYGHHIRPG